MCCQEGVCGLCKICLFLGFEGKSCCVIVVGLVIVAVLLQPPESWDYRCVAMHTFSFL